MACVPLRSEFPGFGPYLVGTAQAYMKGSTPPRDIDVRHIMRDEEYARFVKGCGGIEGVRFLGLAIAQYLASLTGLPIDFQFQQATAANKHSGYREPLGIRGMGHFAGDAEGATDD